MQHSDAPPARQLSPNHIRRNRVLLICLMILSMLPLIGAVWVYYGIPGSVAGAQTNQGALLDPPAQLEELGLLDAGGRVLVPGSERRWRLVVFPGRDCGSECLEALQLLRQLHILLGRDDGRVLRLAAFTARDGAGLREELERRLPEMAQLDAAEGLLGRVLGERELRARNVRPLAEDGPDSGVLVVDPLGNVILYHGLDQIGPDLLSDLKQLLRLSNIG